MDLRQRYVTSQPLYTGIIIETAVVLQMIQKTKHRTALARFSFTGAFCNREETGVSFLLLHGYWGLFLPRSCADCLFKKFISSGIFVKQAALEIVILI